MQSGQLRHRLTIEAKEETRDPRGGIIETWIPVAECWGHIQPLRMRELFLAQQVEARVSHRVTLRYTAGLTNQHRLVYAGRVFHLQPPLATNEERREMELLVMEQV